MVNYPRDIRSGEQMISFAGNGEDILIDRVFHRKSGFFIDVGAFHPVAGSITKYFSLQGWHGINIEPDEGVFRELINDRPGDINLNCAVGRTRGRVLFHQVPGSGLSTISPTFLAELPPQTRAAVQCREIEMRSLADICAEFVTGEIDFLKIDAEGAEADILAGADWQRFRPRLLVIEATRPWTSEAICGDWEPALLSQGYALRACDGINRYYLRREDDALAEQLSMPVNVLDSYVSIRELQLRQQNAALQTEIQRLRNPGMATQT
jgi:FkbM family methyltransferase